MRDIPRRNMTLNTPQIMEYFFLANNERAADRWTVEVQNESQKSSYINIMNIRRKKELILRAFAGGHLNHRHAILDNLD